MGHASYAQGSGHAVLDQPAVHKLFPFFRQLLGKLGQISRKYLGSEGTEIVPTSRMSCFPKSKLFSFTNDLF